MHIFFKSADFGFVYRPFRHIPILCIISPEIEFLADPVLVSVIAQCLSCFACLLKEDY